jgi:hypothetical protein
LADKDAEKMCLTRKAAALFREHGWVWYRRPSQPPGWRAGWHELFCQYDRGMLTELRVAGRVAHLVADLSGLFAAEPVGAVTFRPQGAGADQIRALARLAVPPRPMRLDFQCGNAQPGLTAVVNSMFATATVSIDAVACGSGPEVALALARSPFLTNLRELTLSGYRIGGAAMALLAIAPVFAKLERLTLKGAELYAIDALKPHFRERLVG